jgi:hypothetical protein
VIDLMKRRRAQVREPVPPPEPRLLAVADQGMVHLFEARLRRQILQEIA